MTGFHTAAVVGLGLVGGSLARDLAERGVRVLGHDRDPESVRAALRDGAVHAALGPGLQGVEEAELVVLAVPVTAAPAVLEALAPRIRSARLVTDVGSTKRSVCDAAEALGLGERFVGSHPMAGSHLSGWEASRPGLFAGARVYLCPTASTAAPALELARELWAGVGALPETADAAEHDRLLASTSHLPDLASAALARTLAAGGVHRSLLGRGGRDVTRLAGGSPEMWTAIALDNAAPLAEAVEAMRAHLDDLRAALLRGDADALHEFFAAAREWWRQDPA
ncbi:MAG TPA: prephenate dehydrogenase/arogenate dehydrogenase family protein [Longimicrobiaceae bacterium]|nr:prephenate dehydrogenase/arogenate dehydrogenase family protein [Longimicrobiaceae bacterium]